MLGKIYRFNRKFIIDRNIRSFVKIPNVLLLKSSLKSDLDQRERYEINRKFKSVNFYVLVGK